MIIKKTTSKRKSKEAPKVEDSEVKTAEAETSKLEVPKGRTERYFFPDERRTIVASSLEEAVKKIREEKKDA
ncbi:MAG TPA: hypothetical protein ENI23_11180 [bacterium]|nr:hypothetical protein [bacterium]